MWMDGHLIAIGCLLNVWYHMNARFLLMYASNVTHGRIGHCVLLITRGSVLNRVV